MLEKSRPCIDNTINWQALQEQVQQLQALKLKADQDDQHEEEK